ncbi:uncharacterized protein V2V93DRAFT_375593 [Kockiozyma suomiensis]|uniref:uncharacterized protein n=1 Tax=Kockiozyma suomiensis TaxID=1337062 RepID=UPI0033437358
MNLSLYRSLLSEAKAFFDLRSQRYLILRIRSDFRRPTVSDNDRDNLWSHARLALQKLKRANAGDYKICSEILDEAWGITGPVRDEHMKRVISHSQEDPFPIAFTDLPFVLPVLGVDNLFESYKDDSINASYQNDSSDDYDDYDECRKIFEHEMNLCQLKGNPKADSLLISLEIPRTHLNAGISQPPFVPLPLKRPHYSGPLRALLAYAGLSPDPKMPLPSEVLVANHLPLPVRRRNAIERRHFKKVVDSVPVPLPQSWINEALDNSLASLHATDDPRRVKFIRKRYWQLFSKCVTLKQNHDERWVAESIQFEKLTPVKLQEWML